jgi:serine/threonine protein kinase
VTAEDPRIGTVVAGYRIEAFVGRGGMGVVYLAVDEEPGTRGRRAAIKLLAPELAADERFNERFRQESQTAASIDHPNVIPIYEAGEEDGVLFIAMRYVEGDDLHAFLRRHGPLSVDLALGIIGQVAAALDVAHLRGLVHRDVKPGNVLLVPPNDPSDLPHVYLTDFGLTKQAKATGGLTQIGQFVGTIDYVAPEQVQGMDVDPRTDVYALGCVLYECLTGETPFRREEEVAALWAHISEPPPRVTARRPDLPPALDDVVAKALAKSPDDRYATCRELMTAARWAVSAQPLGPQVPITSPQPGGPVTPLGQQVATYPPPVPPSWPQQPSSRRRTAILLWAIVGVAAAAVAITLALVLGGGGAPERPFPDPGEGQLQAQIPPELQDPPCTRAPALPPQASASLDCRTKTSQSYRFTLYPDANSMNARFNNLVAARGTPPAGNDCEQGQPVLSTWGPGADEDTVLGRLFCHFEGSRAILVWTHNERLILAQGYRPDGDLAALYDAWAEAPDYG